MAVDAALVRQCDLSHPECKCMPPDGPPELARSCRMQVYQQLRSHRPRCKQWVFHTVLGTLSIGAVTATKSVNPSSRSTGRSSTADVAMQDSVARVLSSAVDVTAASECPVAQEFVFLMDSSASVGEDNFVKAKDFLKALVSGLPGPPVRSGVLQFEDRVQLISPIQSNRSDLLSRIDLMEFSIGETRMAQAFQQARAMLGSSSGIEDKLVLIITDGLPNDASEAQQQADNLRFLGVRLCFVYVNGLTSGRRGPPPILEGMVSEPKAANIFSVDSYSVLSIAVSDIIRMIRRPCPCREGVSVPVMSPGGDITNVNSTKALPHGGAELLDCAAYFPKHSGSIELICEDASITAKLTCARICEFGAAVNFSIAGTVSTLSLTDHVASGAAEEFACAGLDRNLNGLARLDCFDGTLSASHTCALGCPAGMRIEARYENASRWLSVTSRGLDHGSWVSKRCEDHFAGSSGSVSLFCSNGALQLLGQCTTPLPCNSSVQQLPVEWTVLCILLFVLGFGILCASLAVCGVQLRKKFIHRRQSAAVSPELEKKDSPMHISVLPEREATVEKAGPDVQVLYSSPEVDCPEPLMLSKPPLAAPCEPPYEAFIGTDTVVDCSQAMGSSAYPSEVHTSRAPSTQPETPPALLSAPETPPLVFCTPIFGKTYVTVDSQTEPEDQKTLENVASQTIARVLQESGCQTSPQVCVELVRGTQRPLDVVCCIDSSVSVGREDFLKSVHFLEYIVRELEMPPVQIGIIRFNHRFSVIAPLTSDRDLLATCLGEMEYEAGETKLAPPLQYAGKMLQGARHDASTGSDSATKAVIVVTDGDPNDLLETHREASALKHDGVVLVFVHIGDAVQPEIMRQLASAPAERYLFPLESYDQLPDASASVLSSVLDVSLWVRKAKCAVDLSTYTEVGDLNTVIGHDIMVPGWEPTGPESWFWEPRAGKCIEDPRVMPWDPKVETQSRPMLSVLEPAAEPTTNIAATQDMASQAGQPTTDMASQASRPMTASGVQTAAECAAPERVQAAAQTVSEPGVQAAAQTVSEPMVQTAAQTVAEQRMQSASQTDPIFRVCLEPWRHSPLDVVICVDSSASFCLERKVAANKDGCVFTESGTFQRAKGFVEQLASSVDMPEVRLGLIRFEDRHEVICPLTEVLEDFVSRLHEMAPAAGETKFAPPLRQALALLAEDRSAEITRRISWAGCLTVAKAVLVITDGDPNDMHEALDAVQGFRQHGVQLLFVKVGRYGGVEKLERLASPWPCPTSPSARGELLPSVPPRGVFESVSDDVEALNALLPDVMQQLVRVTRRVSRASCTLPLVPYEELAGEVHSLPGQEILLPEQTPLVDPHSLCWTPCLKPLTPKSQSSCLPPPAPAVDVIETANSGSGEIQSFVCQLCQQTKQQMEGLEQARRDLITKLDQAELHIRQISAELNSAQELNAVMAAEAKKRQESLKELSSVQKLNAVLAANLAEAKKGQESVKDASQGAEALEREKAALQAALQDAHAILQASKAKPSQSEVEGECNDLRRALAVTQGSLDTSLSREAELLAREQHATKQAEAKEQENQELRQALFEARESMKCAEERNAALQAAKQDDAALQARCADLQVHLKSAEKMADALAYVLATGMGWSAESSVGPTPDEKVCPERRVPSTLMDTQDIKLETQDSSCSLTGPEPLMEPAPQSSSDSRSPQGGQALFTKRSKSLQGSQDTLSWIKEQLEHEYGDLATAFSKIDDNTSRQITVTKLSKALNDFGVARHLSEALFRRLSHLAHCEMRGSLTLQDWLAAFGEERIAQPAKRPSSARPAGPPKT